MRRSIFLFALLSLTLVACSSALATETSPFALEEESTPVRTETSIPSEVPVTQTQAPTATQAAPFEISEDQFSEEGCSLVSLNTDSWGTLSSSYNSGGDPFYQFHDNEEGFYFNVELYTVYGAGWTGQTGTFDIDCNSNGLCIYLVPNDVNPYLASAGEIAIDSLSQVDGTLQRPVAITMSNLLLEPVPGSGSQGCYYIEQVSIAIEE